MSPNDVTRPHWLKYQGYVGTVTKNVWIVNGIAWSVSQLINAVGIFQPKDCVRPDISKNWIVLSWYRYIEHGWPRAPSSAKIRDVNRAALLVPLSNPLTWWISGIFVCWNNIDGWLCGNTVVYCLVFKQLCREHTPHYIVVTKEKCGLESVSQAPHIILRILLPNVFAWRLVKAEWLARRPPL